MVNRDPKLDPARWYVVVILGLVYALNIADRYVVSTVLEPIRLEFHLLWRAVLGERAVSWA